MLSTKSVLTKPIIDSPIFGIVGTQPSFECPQDTPTLNHRSLVDAMNTGIILYLNEKHPAVAELQKLYFTCEVGGMISLTDPKLRHQHAILSSEARRRLFTSWVAVSCEYAEDTNRILMKRIWMGEEADAVTYSMQYAIAKEKAGR